MAAYDVAYEIACELYDVACDAAYEVYEAYATYVIPAFLFNTFAVLVIGICVLLWRMRLSVKRERDASELNKIMLDFSPLIMNIWDENINLISTSQQSVEMFGLDSKEQYIARFNELSPEFQPCGTASGVKAASVVKRAFEEGSAKFEWMHQTLDGEPIPSEITLQRFSRSDKYMVAAYTVDLRPIKTAMQLENERELNDRIQLMLDAAPIMIEYWNRDYDGIYSNKPSLDFFGLSSQEEYKHDVIGPLFGLAPDGTSIWEEWKGHLEKAFESGSGSFEIMVNKSDETVYLEVEAIRIRYNNDFVVLTYSRDVSSLKDIQKERQRVEIAEESSLAKSRFLARMSHEIRTPLTAVLGMSEIQLQSSNLPPEIEDSFSKIHSSASTLLGIVNDILDLSKIEAGKMDIICDRYKTASLINDLAAMHRAVCEHKKLQFNLSVDENLPSQFIGDSLRIGQILNNLLSNASKYTKAGGSVFLSFEFEDGALKVSVKDTGIGMTKTQLDSLIQNKEYTRFHEQEYRYVEGTGLGVPIVYSLLKLMDATIEMESEVGKGTSVVVQIPQEVAEAKVLGKELSEKLEQFKETEASMAKKKFRAEKQYKGKVMVVDDVAANLIVARGFLKQYGLEAEAYNNGFDAITKVEEGNTYDIIFMDHMMPDIDGVEAMQKIRAMGYTRPIVAFTANVMTDQIEEFMKGGFDGFISKPIQAKQLNDVLGRFLDA